MKKNLIFSVTFIILGLFIALGPQFIFKVCNMNCGCCGDVPKCHYTALAEIGMGLLITALGLCFIVFIDPKTQFGLLIGVFLSSIVSLFIPHTLIGGCDMADMTCRRIAFPALTVINIVLIAFSVVIMFITSRQKHIQE